MKKLLFLLCLFVSVHGFAQKLFPIEKKGKWGYMDQEGNMVIDFKYDLAGNFNEGYASVALERMPCLIDIHEHRIIDSGLYQFIGPCSENMVSVMDYKFKRKYINVKTKQSMILSADIYDAGNFHNGFARVGKKKDEHEMKFGHDIITLDYKFAFIRRDGSFLTDFDFDDADDFEDPVIRIMKGRKFGLLDSSGKVIVEPTYTNMSAFNEGLAVVEKNGTYGYINMKGEEVIPPRFEYAKEFNEGLAAIYEKGKFGFINTSGEVVIAPQFEDVRPFSEGRAAVQLMNKWAFIDQKGTFIYQPQFEAAGFFSEGLCPVRLKGKWGALDKEGHIMVPFEFENVGIFEDGIAEVIFKSINLYVDRRGNILPHLK